MPATPSSPFRPGAGGTEAQDWSEMLLRMYLYWFNNRGWDVSEVDRQYGEQAGIKNVTLYVKGGYAFGYLRAEAGVHRLVRPSPYNSQGKRQTSFASVTVVPEFDEADTETEIPEDDLDFIAFVRASGPGGQNVNKVASVRSHHAQAHRHHRHLFRRAQPAAKQTTRNEHPHQQVGSTRTKQAG